MRMLAGLLVTIALLLGGLAPGAAGNTRRTLFLASDGTNCDWQAHATPLLQGSVAIHYDYGSGVSCTGPSANFVRADMDNFLIDGLSEAACAHAAASGFTVVSKYSECTFTAVPLGVNLRTVMTLSAKVAGFVWTLYPYGECMPGINVISCAIHTNGS